MNMEDKYDMLQIVPSLLTLHRIGRLEKLKATATFPLGTYDDLYELQYGALDVLGTWLAGTEYGDTLAIIQEKSLTDFFTICRSQSFQKGIALDSHEKVIQAKKFLKEACPQCGYYGYYLNYKRNRPAAVVIWICEGSYYSLDDIVQIAAEVVAYFEQETKNLKEAA